MFSRFSGGKPPSRVMSLTFLRRAGGSTANGIYSVDGIAMEVLYSTDLMVWEVTALEGVVPAGLPMPPAGYEYASIVLPPAVLAGTDRAFMRVRISVL